MKEVNPTSPQEIILAKDGLVVRPSTFLAGELGVITNKLFQPGDLVFVVTGPITPNRTKHSFQFGPNDHIEPLVGMDGRPGLGYFLNHSCDPNVSIHIVCNNQGRYIQVIAYKEIKAGEEIKVDYATMEFETTVSQHPCKCISPQCRGYIKGYKDLPDEKKDDYISKGLIPAYLLELDQKR